MAHEIQMPLAIDDIDIGQRRQVDTGAVRRLAESIEKIGLRHPITVVKRGDRYRLVAGLHRMEACRKLGREHVMATITPLTNADAKLWEIAENLHRAELTNIQRAEQIEEWRQLTAEKVSNGLTPAGGKQPAEAGVRKTAEALGVSPTTVENAAKIASISREAKEAAEECGVTTVRELLQVADAPKPEQVATVHSIHSAKLADNPLNDFESKEKQVAALMAAWNKAGPEAREEFLSRIDRPIMDRRFA